MTGSEDAGRADALLVGVIRSGDLEHLAGILAANPELANARLATSRSGLRTPLHVVTDWPGYYPNGPEAVRLLIAAGADPNGTIGGRLSETPLHWAASTDDVDVAEALIEGGAELETPGASIAGGPPLDNAVGYGCWHVARLLVRRGARVDRLWHAAALGDLTRLSQLTTGDPPPGQTQLDEAFWHACHGGQLRAAEYLLGLGADIDSIPGYTDSTPLEVAGSTDTRRDLLTDWLRQQGARPRPEGTPAGQAVVTRISALTYGAWAICAVDVGR